MVRRVIGVILLCLCVGGSTSASIQTAPIETLSDLLRLQEDAESGDAKAQYELAQVYAQGQIVLQDVARAYSWLSRSATQGHPEAQHNLALMYHHGVHVQRDLPKAAQWYQKAASQGVPGAQCNLGYMYEKGQGVQKDHDSAIEWYRKAAEQQDNGAQMNLALLYEERNDERSAIAWYIKAAENGNSKAQYNLALRYENGKGVAKNYAEAERLYIEAADQGLPQAQYNLGAFYATGKGGKPDHESAIRWFTKAAAQKDTSALYTLAMTYYRGEGVTADLVEAWKWAMLAQMNGRDMLSFLARVQQRMAAPDIEKARKLFEEYIAAREGEIEAQRKPSRVSAEYSKTQEGFHLLRFDGLYRADEDGSSPRYLRFYDDGVVIDVTTSGTPDQIAAWFTRETRLDAYYHVEGRQIGFTSDSYMGSVEYRGQILEGQLVLSWRSRINGNTDKGIYRFVPNETVANDTRAREVLPAAREENSVPSVLDPAVDMTMERGAPESDGAAYTMAELADKLQQAYREITALRLENAKLRAELDATNATLLERMQEHAESQEGPGKAAQKGQRTEAGGLRAADRSSRDRTTGTIEGLITEIDEEHHLASISIGLASGVKQGDKLHVIRDGKFICDVVILDIESHTAVGILELIVDKPKVGDRATNRLE